MVPYQEMSIFECFMHIRVRKMAFLRRVQSDHIAVLTLNNSSVITGRNGENAVI